MKNEDQKMLEEINRDIGSIGVDAVEDYMRGQGWGRLTTLRSPQFARAMISIGVQETAAESPERFIDCAFWKHHDDGTEEWELIQVKTTCTRSTSRSVFSIELPRHIQERYISYTKAIISQINNNELSPFPDLVKVNLYIANRTGLFRVDMMDLVRHSHRNGRATTLFVDRDYCDSVRNWTIDERPEYEGHCYERNRLLKELGSNEEDSRQLNLHLGGSIG